MVWESFRPATSGKVLVVPRGATCDQGEVSIAGHAAPARAVGAPLAGAGSGGAGSAGSDGSPCGSAWASMCRATPRSPVATRGPAPRWLSAARARAVGVVVSWGSARFAGGSRASCDRSRPYAWSSSCAPCAKPPVRSTYGRAYGQGLTAAGPRAGGPARSRMSFGDLAKEVAITRSWRRDLSGLPQRAARVPRAVTGWKRRSAPSCRVQRGRRSRLPSRRLLNAPTRLAPSGSPNSFHAAGAPLQIPATSAGTQEPRTLTLLSETVNPSSDLWLPADPR